MGVLKPMIECIRGSGLLFPLSFFSIVAFVGSILALPYLIARMPEDYFIREEPQRTPVRRLIRNVVGVMLIFAGTLMLFLPGQGVLTVLVGVSFLSFRKKRDLERVLVERAGLLGVMNAIRARSGRPPLIMPAQSSRRSSER